MFQKVKRWPKGSQGWNSREGGGGVGGWAQAAGSHGTGRDQLGGGQEGWVSVTIFILRVFVLILVKIFSFAISFFLHLGFLTIFFYLMILFSAGKERVRSRLG